MPIYDYNCSDCGNNFEELFLSYIAVPKNLVCPKCGSCHVSQKISLSSFVLKGADWCNGSEQKAATRKKQNGFEGV